VSRKLRFGNFGEFINDLLQSFKTFKSQWIAITCRGHKCHAHQVRQMQYQKISCKTRTRARITNQRKFVKIFITITPFPLDCCISLARARSKCACLLFTQAATIRRTHCAAKTLVGHLGVIDGRCLVDSSAWNSA